MKSESVKTISIFMASSPLKARWIFDTSDKIAERLMNEYQSPDDTFVIENVPTKTGTKTLYIPKKRIDHVEVE